MPKPQTILTFNDQEIRHLLADAIEAHTGEKVYPEELFISTPGSDEEFEIAVKALAR